MMFRGAYDSDFYRQVHDLLHEQVAFQQSRPLEHQPHNKARAALDARWDALIASEQAHRTKDAVSPPATTPGEAEPSRHATTAQNR
jgi:anaerobic magnesium-protoporphyrin IX monomethyl ester cyclase